MCKRTSSFPTIRPCRTSACRTRRTSSWLRLGNGIWHGHGLGERKRLRPRLRRQYRRRTLSAWAAAVSAPVPLNNVEAEFSDEARRAKYQGVCLISLIVDAQGNPQNPRVVRALGMGLDEKALEAVMQVQIQAGHEGRQDAGPGDDQRRDQLPALLKARDGCNTRKLCSEALEMHFY